MKTPMADHPSPESAEFLNFPVDLESVINCAPRIAGAFPAVEKAARADAAAPVMNNAVRVREAVKVECSKAHP